MFTEVTNRIPVEQTIDDYLAIDSDVPDTREDMSTEQIIAAVQETVEVEPTEDDTEDPTLPPVSAKSALKAVETLRLFLLQQENCSTLVNGLDGYESQIQNIATNSLKQKKITSFFTTNGHFVCLLLVCLIPSTRKVWAV